MKVLVASFGWRVDPWMDVLHSGNKVVQLMQIVASMDNV